MNRTIKIYTTGRYFVERDGVRGLYVCDDYGRLVAVY